MKTPKDLFALICEDGSLYPEDGNGCHSRADIEELLEEIAHAGAECTGDCNTHRIVRFIPLNQDGFIYQEALREMAKRLTDPKIPLVGADVTETIEHFRKHGLPKPKEGP
jgi:hypothetical protein